MRSALLALAITPVLAGCNLDVLEGKESPYKVAHEQRVALITPPEPIEPEPVIEPPCVPVYRVTTCE